MSEYVTTNIRLPRAMHERIKKRAQEENKSFAQVVRESVAVYLIESRTGEDSDATNADDPIYRLADLARPDEVIGGDRPTDTSTRHDYYLYGADLDQVPAGGKPNA
jgi:predicted DNA-binding protein